MILNSSSGATLLFELLVLLIMEDKDTPRVTGEGRGVLCAYVYSRTWILKGKNFENIGLYIPIPYTNVLLNML